MCLKPNIIKNPLYSRSSYAMVGEDFIQLPKELSSREEYIEVPCCTCAECRASYLNSVLQRGIVESRTSYMFFVTLTYDNNHIPSLVLPNGKVIYYCDYSHIQDLFKRIRHHNVIDREFRYICATEYGDTNHRPHFHLLIFIAKCEDDTPTIPLQYEALLFDNLQKYYALNVGTRKNPIYEPLFTYKMRYTNQGVKTNYFVKYVNDEVPEPFHNCNDNLTYVKTIRYLLSYVNKGSSFDDQVRDYLQEIHDKILVKKLKSILMSRIRYSKGLGYGFVSGFKQNAYRSYVKLSQLACQFSQTDLPPTFSEFAECYPELIPYLSKFIMECPYRKGDSIVDSLDDSTMQLHIILVTYFPNYFTYLYRRFFKPTPQSDCISYLFQFLKPYTYHKSKIRTNDFLFNDTFTYIRQGIEDGIRARIPYLCFPIISEGRYMALCKFYRERFTTPEDTLAMYDAVGASNYDEWLRIFISYNNKTKEAIANANKVLRESEVLQKNCSTKSHIYDLYTELFTKK